MASYGFDSASLQYVYTKASSLGLDPAAVLAVASQEGAGGGIGDGGHAFGPWQLNDAVGVLTGKFPNKSSDQIQAWAWSKEGIDYALAGMANVAKGLTGADAVKAIVYDFERPADKPGETQRADNYYPQAQAQLKSANSGGGTLNQLANSFTDPRAYLHLLTFGLVGAAPGTGQGQGGLHGVTTTGQSVADAVDSVPKFLSKITSQSFLIRALEIVGGAGLVGVGLILLARQVGLADTASIAPMAAAAKEVA